MAGHRQVRRGLTAVLAVACAAALTTVRAGPAQAHDDHEPGVSDAQHAEDDLVGTSMSTIVTQTRANARELGVDDAQARATAGAAAPGRGVEGEWSAVVPTEVVPVFQAVLPSGRVLIWDSVGDSGSTPDGSDHTFTRARVWDPTTDTARDADLLGSNIFCAGYTQLPDGDVLVVGGNKNNAQAGIRQTHLFDWETETWSRGPDMAADRWYPSVAALADGSAVIVGGGPTTAEVYEPDEPDDMALRLLNGFAGYDARIYPYLVPRTDGRVEFIGPVQQFRTIDTRGAGAQTVKDAVDFYRDYASFATFAPDRTLVAGGGSYDEDGARQPPQRSAKVVDTSGSSTTATPTAPMAYPRRQFQFTALADGTVLATGGMSTNPYGRGADRLDGAGQVDLEHAVRAAERWDPRTGRWTTLASADRVREYHSAATLLPDGRVLTGGGGVCGICVDRGYLEKNIEYFSPPYLFDASGRPASRPAITGAPATVPVGGTFSLASPQAPTISRLTLVKLGAATHGVDQGQRVVPLGFTRRSGALDVTAPATSGTAPPGYYMLFAVDGAGVPSVARMVQVTGPAAGPPTPTPAPTPTPTPVPTRSANLARGHQASATASAPAHRPARAVDGRTRTWWQAPRRGRPSWRVDLGRSRRVDSVTVVPHGRLRGYQVQTSRDGRTFTTAATVSTATIRRRTTTFAARSARYVRVLPAPWAARSGFAVGEVQVFGPA